MSKDKPGPTYPEAKKHTVGSLAWGRTFVAIPPLPADDYRRGWRRTPLFDIGGFDEQ